MTAAALKAWKHKHCHSSPSTCWAASCLPIWSRPRQAFHQASQEHDCMVALTLISVGISISALHGTGAQPHAGQPGVSPSGFGKGNFPCCSVFKYPEV